ncbi:MAG: hypothetical protein ACRDSH_18565 [Pseudonocardiaceae bacterium]
MSRYVVIAVLVAVAVFAFMAKHRSADDNHHLTPSHQDDTCERMAHYLGPDASCPW